MVKGHLSIALTFWKERNCGGSVGGRMIDMMMVRQDLEYRWMKMRVFGNVLDSQST
jgi:hypothetical protein